MRHLDLVLTLISYFQSISQRKCKKGLVTVELHIKANV
jgi:hypothetical protein